MTDRLKQAIANVLRYEEEEQPIFGEQVESSVPPEVMAELRAAYLECEACSVVL